VQTACPDHPSPPRSPSPSSQISLLSMREDRPFISLPISHPSTPSPVSRTSRPQPGSNLFIAGTSQVRQPDTPSSAKKTKLPLLVEQLLESLRPGQAKISDVLFVYNHIGRQGWEEALVDLRVNRAVARVIAHLLDYPGFP
jgi:hypothetical protein